MIVPVQKKRVYEDISEQIRQQIETGAWGQGERIQGELELAELFQVSRGSIREAIKSLQLQGILEAKSGQGTFVSADALQKIRENRLANMISDRQFRDQVLECRYLIEPQAAFVAAQNVTDEDIDYLKHTYEEMMSCGKEGNVKGMNEWGAAFHTRIIDMVKNEVLSALYRSIADKSLENREEFIEASDDTIILGYHEEHLDLIEAFEKKDPVLARKIMDKHIGRKLDWKVPKEA